MNLLFIMRAMQGCCKLKCPCSCSVSEPEQVANKELKGVAEEDALRKLLSSGEEDEEEEEVQQMMSLDIKNL
jgi:hypothetical protein